MALSPEDQKRIIDAESAWIDQSFSPLDLSAYPALNQPPTETHDDKFARQYGDTALSRSSSDLRQFIANPDSEALQRVATETGQPDFVSELRERQGERVALQFKEARPAYIPCDDNFDRIIATMAFNFLAPADQDGDTSVVMDRLMDAGVWTVQHLCACFDALYAQGLMLLPAGEARNLTEGEKLEVMRMAQSGHAEKAIEKYLQFALEETPTIEILSDPDYRDACDAAVWFVFQCATPDFSHTAERAAFIKRYTGSRALTLNLLSHAWAACKKNEELHTRDRMLGLIEKPDQTPPTEKELDSLDDRSLDNLYHSTLGEYAKTARRAPGVLV